LSHGLDETNAFVLQANELEIRDVKYKTMNWHNECDILMNELNEYNHNIL